MRPSSSAVALAETNAEQQLLNRLALQTPRLSALKSARHSPKREAQKAPATWSASVTEEDKAVSDDSSKDVAPIVALAATLVKQGMGNLVDDSFNRCFEETFPDQWNWNVYLFPAWVLGVVFRLLILFPLRLTALVLGNIIFFIGFIFLKLTPFVTMESRLAAERWLIQMLCSVFVMSWSGVIKFHGVRPVSKGPNPPGIFVANHSSMIDFIVLQQSHNYAVVGQQHKGWIAFFQNHILSSLDCIWFDRSDTENKALVATRLAEHAHDASRVPILVFPEGTCVNNKHVIMFRKTVFDLDVPINPIAIKYNDVFVPGYWNSRRVSFAGHLVTLMTSWAVVCDVWYMDPMTKREGESAIDFAKRVQQAIARRAGIRAVDWDGYMKYWSPSERFIRSRRTQCAEFLIEEALSPLPAFDEQPPPLMSLSTAPARSAHMGSALNSAADTGARSVLSGMPRERKATAAAEGETIGLPVE